MQKLKSPAADSTVSHAMRIDVERAPDGLVLVHVTGEVDILSAPRLRWCVNEATAVPASGLVLDLEKVSFLSSAGLSVLVDIAHYAPERKLTWGVAAGCRPVLRPLHVTGFITMVPVYPTVPDAVDALATAS